jgi:hypothetical protein
VIGIQIGPHRGPDITRTCRSRPLRPLLAELARANLTDIDHPDAETVRAKL